MRKKVLAFMLSVAMVLSLLPMNFVYADESIFDGGDGTSEGTAYEIASLATLEEFRNAVNTGTSYSGQYIKLTADIDMSGTYSGSNSWEPIGKTSNKFAGTFDGAGHKIKGLYINDSVNDRALFGVTDSNATIKDLGVYGSVTGVVAVGGVVGENNGTITNCNSNVTVTGRSGCGGIAGENTGKISLCYNTGTITTTGSDSVGYTGGIAGNNKGYVLYCYNTGKISSESSGAMIGGVAGRNYNARVYYCYNVGEVSADTTNIGAVVGWVKETYVGYCYYSSSSGVSDSNATMLSKMNSQDSFNQWNFDSDWVMDEERPLLRSNMEPTGTAVSPYRISSLAELKEFAEKVNGGETYDGKHVKLTADIDASAEEWTQIGTYKSSSETDADNNMFQGTFDGDGHTVKITVTSGDRTGLFGAIKNATVKNVVVDGTLTGLFAGGGIVGYAVDSTIEKCTNLSNVSGDTIIGGIVGEMLAENSDDPKGKVLNCVNKGSVSFTGELIALYNGGIGGVVRGEVANCLNLGEISTTNSKNIAFSAGGIVGKCMGGNVTNSYYLDTTVSGVTSPTEYGTSKTADALASGEVAWALQNAQGENGSTVWGQQLLDTSDGETPNNDVCPILTSEDSKVVRRVQFMQTDADSDSGFKVYTTRYVNTDNALESNFPENPSVDGYRFIRWSQTAATDGVEFTKDTVVSQDMTVYGVKGETTSVPTSTFTGVKGTRLSILIDNYIKNASGNNGQLTYDLDDADLPPGMTIDNFNGYTRISGIPTKSGKYEVPIKVTNSSDIMLLSDEGNSDAEVKTVTLTIDINLKGSGTSSSPYLIEDIDDLKYFRDNVNGGNAYKVKFIKLAADIDMSSAGEWTPIGDKFTKTFEGTFDGDNHKITGMNVEKSNKASGLFGYTDAATIKNLEVHGTSKGKDYAGGIVGCADGYTRIENCANYCTVESECAGGIVGYAEQIIKFENCINYGTVNGTEYASGILGGAEDKAPEFINCVNVGEIESIKGSKNALCSRQKGSYWYASNCYYLDRGIEYDDYSGDANKKTAEEFASGSVTWELQNKVSGSTQIWGQQLKDTANADKYPVITNDKADTVYKVTFKSNSGEVYGYGNPSGMAALPAAPTSTEYTFSHWTVKSYEIDKEFTADTQLSKDTTVYAVGDEITMPTNKNDTFKINKHYPVKIDLNDYVYNKSHNSKDFDFVLADGEALPEGLEFDEQTGEISGEATTVGEKTVKFNYSNNGIALMSLDTENSTLTLKFEVTMAGDGSQNSPYEIWDLADLEWLRDKTNTYDSALDGYETFEGKYFKLMNDINMSEEYNSGGYSWTPIANYYTDDHKLFDGTFDGNGHEIESLYIEKKSRTDQALFGKVGSKGTVKNLTVSGNVTASDKSAGIVANNNGTVENCINKASVSGWASYGDLYTNGGVVASNSGKIIKCVNEATVNGSLNVGGIAGSNYTYGEIISCYNVGDISGRSAVGGLVGNHQGTLKNSYNSGSLSSVESHGSVYGIKDDNATVSGCYYLADDSNTENISGATAMSEEQFENGEVAWTLQNDLKDTSNGRVWGQNLGSDELPILTDESASAVYKISYMVAGDNNTALVYNEFAEDFANPSGVAALPSETPQSDKYTFSYWTSDRNTNESFTTSTAISGDMEIYAVGKQITAATDKSDNISLKNGVEITEIDLNDYVKNVSGDTKNFAFDLAVGEELPSGLVLDKYTGKITGKPSEGGIYEVTFTIANDGIALMALNATNDELTVTFDIDLAGDGTETKPYTIATLNELEYLQVKVNGGNTYEGKFIKLANDLDMSSVYGDDKKSWTPMGKDADSEADVRAFNGTFDGNGCEIEKLYIKSEYNSNGNYQGLFGYIGEKGTVKNLKISGTVTGYNYVGSIAGKNDGHIIGCDNSTVVKGNYEIGGLAGYNNGTVEQCRNTAKIETIGNNGSDGTVGGITAHNCGTVINCYNIGDISGFEEVGGIVGYNEGGKITNCYSYGTIKVEYNNGHCIAGGNQNGEITNCYYVSDRGTSEYDGGATAKTLTEFASGEIAWALQGDQDTLIWGQDLGESGSMPTLECIDGDARICKITIDGTVSYLESGDRITQPSEPSRPDDPNKSDYVFAGWYDDDNNSYDFDNEVTGDVTLTPKWKKVVTIVGTDTSWTYTGATFDVSTMFTGVPEDAEVVYAIESGAELATLSGSTLTIKKAGEIQIKASVTEDETYLPDSKSAKLTVEHGHHDNIEFPTASGIVYGDTLEKSTLSGGSQFGTFAWADSTVVPTVDNVGFAVTFTPNDTDLYAYDASDLTDTVTVEVSPRAITVAWDGTDGIVYDGNTHTITPRVTNKVYDSDEITLETSGDLSAVDMGEYTANITGIVGNINYTLGTDSSLTKVWHISADTNVFTDTISITGWTYGDTPNTPTATAKYGTVEFVYSDKADGTFVNTVPTNAGTYYAKATVAGTTNYSELSGEPMQFVIEPYDITGATITLGDTLIYNGTEQTQTIGEVSIGSFTLGEGDYDITGDKQTNAGTAYTLTITGKGNFKGSESANYDVLPKLVEKLIPLTAPVKNGKPQMSIETDEYTATVTWSPEVTEMFEPSTEYTAVVTITCDENHEIGGISENWFSVDKAVSVTNAAGSGIVTVVFDRTSSAGGGSTTVSSNYTVRFNSNGGSSVKSLTVEKNDCVVEPTAPTKSGFTFGGWFTDKGLTTEYDFDTAVTKSMTLYAMWIENEPSTDDKVDVDDKNDVDDKDDVNNSDDIDTPNNGGNTPSNGNNSGNSEAWENPFGDVTADKWFYDSVKYANMNGLMDGITDTEFEPETNVTRAMLVTVLWRAEGEERVGGEITFGDVAADSYYADAVRWAVNAGIVDGVSDTEFAPDMGLTREQLATIIYRYAEYKGVAPTGAWAIRLGYGDLAQVSEYAVEGVMYCTLKGIMQGKDDNMFAPQDNVTRAEIAAVLSRFIAENK